MALKISGTSVVDNSRNLINISNMTYQEFTSSGTWTKPTGCRFIYVEAIGAGGGGGSGAKRNQINISGGGGGAGGLRLERLMPASMVSSTVAVTVGSGGSGGSATTVEGSNGNGGTNGGNTLFGSYVKAYGGDSGDGGGPFNSGSSPTVTKYMYSSTFGLEFSSEGGWGYYQTAPGDGGQFPWGPGGGGGGGGIGGTQSIAAYSGGTGGRGFSAYYDGWNIYFGRGASGGGLGSSGLDGYEYPGDGGGGGGASISSNGGNGGDGFSPGGGGGGGASTWTGSASGAGGNGAPGVVRVWAW